MGVDAIVNHRYTATKRLRKSAGLPLCGRNARISHLEMQQIIEVFEAQPADIAFNLNWKLRIKTHIRAMRVVVKLAVNSQLWNRPDVFQKQALTLAVVGNDHIGREALGLQPMDSA